MTSNPPKANVIYGYARVSTEEQSLQLQLDELHKHGVRVGRPVVNKQKLDRAIQLYKGGELSVQEISAIVGISRSTLYKYIKDLKEKEDANENSYE